MFTTQEILKATKAKRLGPKTALSFDSISQHSKTIDPSQIFIAIQGERFDGHSFLKEVFEKGVKAAIVQKGKYNPKEFPTKIFFVVPDTLKALGQLALFHRKKFLIPIIGITGSNGKTTTKDLIAHLLETQFKVLKTEGNLNNLIGLPFTIFGLNTSHTLALLEMGMSIPFEIKRLCQIAHPTAGLITNIGRAHLLTMKSLSTIAHAKGALLEALPKKGKAFINMDDPYLKPYQKKLTCEVITYSLKDSKAHVFGKIKEECGLEGIEMTCQWGKQKKESVTFHLPLSGEHNAMNALAAVTVALSFGIRVSHIQKAMESFIPTSGRSTFIRLKKGVTLIDDSYNANPNSMPAAIQMLKKISKNQQTYAVLGDMLELGAKEIEYHREIGRIIEENNIDNVLTFGLLSQYIIKEVKNKKKGVSFWTLDQNELILQLKQELIKNPGVVLIKGSHGMRMDKVVVALIEAFGKDA